MARVLELRDLPPPHPSVSVGRVLAGFWTVALVYEAATTIPPRSDEWAVVAFERVHWLSLGGPNDEARHRHPLHPPDLGFFGVQEVLESPTIEERLRIEHKDGTVNESTLAGQRHFLFAMKENMFECIAESVRAVGVYPSADEAIAAGIDVAFGARPYETSRGQ